ncbi:MAG: mnmE [Cyanobacteria bacterium RYN_339]|nr:mnmE [Cyanobacteria bacterium RYN_339]
MGIEDTIAAIATAAGPGAVGVVRVSGPGALAVADALFRTGRRAVPREPLSARPSHQVHHGWLQAADGRWLDEALVLVMRAPRSFTGEDVVEFQTHGGATVPYAVLEACLAAGARLAAAGEFTKRAFLNGRLDLAQAEAVNDLVTAKGERGLAGALAQLDGALSRQVATVRADVIGFLARLEAAIDYPDEIEDLPAGEAIDGLTRLLQQVDGFLATARQGQVFREGARLAIVGRPNAGKSSLLNALLGHERAIVTAIPGTTRDSLEEGLQLAGVPFRVVDTAGIRETLDPVEVLGVARSRDLLATADVVLLVVDLLAGVGAVERELAALAGDRPLVVVGNKCDLADAAGLDTLGAPHVAVSATTGAGLPALQALLVAAALGMPAAQASPTSINARHRACLEATRASLTRALASVHAGLPGDFWAIDLTAAAAGLAEVTGDALAEEVIDQVFARFCVGK